jgi:hypothetical protein
VDVGVQSHEWFPKCRFKFPGKIVVKTDETLGRSSFWSSNVRRRQNRFRLPRWIKVGQCQILWKWWVLCFCYPVLIHQTNSRTKGPRGISVCRFRWMLCKILKSRYSPSKRAAFERIWREKRENDVKWWWLITNDHKWIQRMNPGRDRPNRNQVVEFHRRGEPAPLSALHAGPPRVSKTSFDSTSPTIPPDFQPLPLSIQSFWLYRDFVHLLFWFHSPSDPVGIEWEEEVAWLSETFSKNWTGKGQVSNLGGHSQKNWMKRDIVWNNLRQTFRSKSHVNN